MTGHLIFFWYKARFCHLLSWFIFPLLLGKLVSSLFQSSIVKRTRSNYCGLPIVTGADIEMNQSNFKIARAKHGKTLINKLCFLMNSDWLRKGRRSLFSQSKRVAIRTVHTFNRFTFFLNLFFSCILLSYRLIAQLKGKSAQNIRFMRFLHLNCLKMAERFVVAYACSSL